MGIKNNHFCYVCSACNRVNCAIDQDDQWSYFLRINLLEQAEIIGGTIPNMIVFGIFCLFKFLFCKNKLQSKLFILGIIRSYISKYHSIFTSYKITKIFRRIFGWIWICLLYTSDAADE